MDEASAERRGGTVPDEDPSVPEIGGDIELGELSTDDSSRRSHCAICLDSYNDGDLICTSNNTACGHRFHRDCMVDWLQKHEDCPCCRRAYLHEDTVK